MEQLKNLLKRKEEKREGGKKRRWKKPVLAAVLAAAVLLIAIRGMMPQKTVLPPVAVYAAERGNLEETLDVTGKIQTERMKTYFSPVAAEVENCNVTLGEYVRAGEMLAGFSLSDLETEKQEAQLNLDSSMASYQEAVAAGNKNASQYQSSAQTAARLETQVAQKKAEVDALKASIDQLTNENTKKSADDANWMNQRKNELTNENTDLDKKKTEKSLELSRKQNELNEVESQLSKAEGQSISSNDISPDIDIDGLNARKTQLQKEIDDLNGQISDLNVRQIEISGELGTLSVNEDGNRQVALAELQSRYGKASQELSELNSDLSEAEGKRDSAEAGILSAESRNRLTISNNLSQLSVMTAEERIQMAKEGIVADFDGVVTDVKVMEGSLAAAGTEMFTISSGQDVSVEVSINKNDLEKLKVGQKAVITSIGRTYEGTVERISHTAALNSQNVPVVSAFIHIDNPDENIYLGMEADVLISLDSAQDTLMIPYEALNEGRDGTFCYVLENGMVTMRLITTGIAADEYIQVTEGLKEGDLVIMTLPQGVEEGMQVQASGVQETQASGDADEETETAAQETERTEPAEAETETAE